MGRILRIILAGVLVLAVAAGLAWSLRLAIAEHILLQRLADRGYPEATLEVTSLSLHRATLEDLELAPAGGPTAARIDVLFPLFEVLGGDLSGVEAEISGLEARVSDEPRPGLAADASADEPAADGLIATLTSLARVDIRRARVHLPPRAGHEWALEFNATLQGGASGLRSAELDGQIDDRDVGLGLTLSARHDGDEVHANIGLLPMGRGVDGHVDLRISPPWDNPRAEVQYAARVDADAGREPEWWPLPWPTAGSARLTGDYQGRLGSTALPQGIDALVQRLVAGNWRGQWQIAGEGLARADSMSEVALVVAGDIATEAGQLIVRTDGEGFIDIGRVDAGQAARLPLPATLARPLVTAPARIQWPARTLARLDPERATLSLTPAMLVTYAARPTRLRLTADADWWPGRAPALQRFNIELSDYTSEPATIEHLRLTGDLGAEPGRVNAELRMPRLALTPVTATDVEATVEFVRDDTSEAARWRIGEAGTISAAGIAWPPVLTSRGALAADVIAGTLIAGAEPEWDFELAVDPARWQAELPNTSPLELHTGAHGLRLSGPSPLFPLARATVTAMDARIDSPALRAEGMHIDVRPGRIQQWLRLRTPRLHIEGGPLPLAPLRLRGHVDDWSDAGQRLQGSGALAGGGADFEISGELPAGTGDPWLRIDWPGIDFTPGGLQPRDLVPAATRAHAVAGTVAAGSELVLAGDGLDARTHVETEGMALEFGEATIRGLNGRVELAGLRPWRTDGNQRLDAERIDFGLPLTAPRARFAIEPRPGRGSVIEIREAAADYAGGRLYMPAWTWDPHADTQAFDLEFGDIDAATLTQDLAIADLDARGSLSGRLPVTRIGDRIIIRGGRLRGRDGYIAYRAAPIDGTEPGVGDAEHAFGDLEHDRLAITIDQDLDREDVVDISARERDDAGAGATHGVRLTGDLAPLIDTILAGEPVSRAALKRYLEAGDIP